jgi:hypothetical protein
MSWPERHLHWTLLLACVATTMTNLVADAFSPYDMRLWLTMAIVYGLPLIPCGWVLRQKGQTLWWLPVIWIPFIWWIYAILYVWPSIPFIGWVIPFVLRNRRQPEYALTKGADGRAHLECSGSQPSGLPCAVRLIGVLTGVIVAICGIVTLKYMIGQVSACFHGVEQVAYPLAVALSLFLTALLLIIPQRIYREKPFVRTLAQFISVCLLAGGVLAVPGGLLLGLAGEAADPGHGIMLIGAAVVAGGILGLISGGVLCARVHATRRNRRDSSPSGSGLAPRPASG